MLFMVDAEAGTMNKTPHTATKHKILRLICPPVF